MHRFVRHARLAGMLRARALALSLASVALPAAATGCGGAAGGNAPVIVSNHVSIVIMNGAGASTSNANVGPVYSSMRMDG